MYSKLCGDTWVLRLEIGEEVLASIAELCKKEKKLCAEISGIGAASTATVGISYIENKGEGKTLIIFDKRTRYEVARH